MRLIDANALTEAFRTYMVENHDREKCVSEENCNACERGCLWRKIVVKAPTIDPESLRPQGEWVQIKSWATKAKYRCSVCGREIMSAQTVNIEKFPYCHCGAKMKGGTHERKTNFR